MEKKVRFRGECMLKVVRVDFIVEVFLVHVHYERIYFIAATVTS